MEAFLKPRVFCRIKEMCVCSRHFSIRSRKENLGLGVKKGNEHDYVGKLNDFYNNKKMQSLWDDTFERISTMQNKVGQAKSQKESNNLSGFGRLSTSKSLPQELFTMDEQQRMKLSFAEGFLYGQTKSTGTSKWRMFVIGNMVILITLPFLISALKKSSQFGKVLMGGKSFEISPEEIEVSFADVKGCDESKKELTDIVEFLKNPEKFSRLGGKLPKGVLLVGPPGTGKTLLARAVAGEADVPFFHASGSEFDEILVGQGARRVRDLFENAKKKTPCVIFIDEIDSVGGKRSNSVIHPYANQTINQLLSEMDGFTTNEGVIVIGATNRENDLDKALLRPGRFDVRVDVPVPDYKGRRELFVHYLSLVSAGKNIDLDTLCRTTVGFTGADIENLVNQAALKSATDNLNHIGQEALEFARDKILMGPERKSRLPDKEQNLMTAYHEGGHALVAMFTKNANNLHKVTIVARGNSLGHTSTLPERDMYQQTKEQMQASIDVMLGGRVAEELIYGSDKVTTGCSDDLRKANQLATLMVRELGMSDKVGVRVVREDSSQAQVVMNSFPDATSKLVESEITRILEESQARVKQLLTDNKEQLRLLAEALIKFETLDAAEVKLVIEGKDPKVRHNNTKLSNLKVGNPTDRLPLDLLK